MDRDKQSRPAPNNLIPSSSDAPPAFLGLAASIEADLARDFERIDAAGWDLNRTQQRLQSPPPVAPPIVTGKTRNSASLTNRGAIPSNLRGKPGDGRAANVRPLDGVESNTEAGSRPPLAVDHYPAPGKAAAQDTLEEFAPRTERFLSNSGLSEFDHALSADPQSVEMCADMAQPPNSQSTYEPAADSPSDADRIPGSNKPANRLQTELRQAREEIDTLRAKSGNGDSGNGSLDPQRRKLDQRALEFRERVIRAQQALDERAKKLKAALTEERERLKAYHAHLQKKARELSEASRRQQSAVEEDVARQREAIEAEKAELDRRRLQLGTMEAELREQARQEMTRKRQELEAAMQERLSEMQHDTAARQTHLDERERNLAIREEQINQLASHRLDQVKRDASAYEQQLLERERELAEQEADLRSSSESRIVAIEEQRAAQQAEIDARMRAIADREAHLNRAHEAITEREKDLQEAVNARLNEIKREAAAKEKDFESREQGLRDRESALTEAVNARISEVKRVNDQKTSELEDRERQVRENEQDLSGRLEAFEKRREDEESDFLIRNQEVTELSRLYGDKATAEATLAARRADLESREKDFARRAEDVDLRERRLIERQARLDSIEPSLDAARQELRQRQEASEQLDRANQQAAERLESQQQAIRAEQAELTKREESYRERIEEFNRNEAAFKSRYDESERLRAELDRDRALLIEAQSSHAQVVSATERRLEELSRQHTELAGARGALQIAQSELATERANLRAEQAALQQERSRLVDDQSSFDLTRGEVESQSQILARDREEVDRRKSQLDADVARLEQDRLALRDLERTVTDQKTTFETVQKETEALRAELSEKKRETEEIRRILTEKSERMRERKARLAEDAALVDNKIKQLNGDLESVRMERIQLAEDRRSIDGQIRTLTEDRRSLEESRAEVDATQAEITAAKSAFEESQRSLTEREARLTERGNQLEAFGLRLKQEFADLQKQRQDLAELELRSEGQERLNAMLKQAEDRDEQLRNREHSLTVQERALSAIASEISASEEDIKRRTKAIESRASELSAETKSFERQRKELEAQSESEREELAQERRQLELELARERDQLRQRERELEMTFARQRDAMESAGQEREEATLSEMRQRVEAGLASRINEITRREQEVEQRCEKRIAEVERDIEQRLGQLGEEIRRQRQTADEQILRRREELEARIRMNTAQLAPSGEMPSPLPTDESSNAPIEMSIPDLSPYEPAESDRVWLAESAETEDEVATLGDADLVLLSDELSRPAEATAGSPANSTVAVTRPPARWGWRSFFSTFFLAVIVGGLAGLAYLWTPSGEVRVRGRIVLPANDASMTAPDQVAAILKPAVLDVASQRLNTDLRKLYREQKLVVTDGPGGQSVELIAKATIATRASAQNWLDTIAQVYSESLSHSAGGSEEVQQRISDLEAQRQAKSEAIQDLRKNIERAENDLAAQSSAEDAQVARQRKENLKIELARALSAVEAAKSGLSSYESEMDSGVRITPTQAQLTEAYKSDVELSQAIDHQKTKAQEFHVALADAMSKSDGPFRELMKDLDEWDAGIKKQLEEQTDKEIKQELQLMLTDLTDYRTQARAFESSWNELIPKVVGWQSADPEILLEYQKAAESLIRDFHSKSRDVFAQAAEKADKIGRSGSEMTKRRVLQGIMTGYSHTSLDARNQWTIAARRVVPLYNVELKALKAAIVDVGPRIKERTAFHRQHLSDELAKATTDERQTRLQKLRADLESATRRHQKLSDEFLKVDEAATQDEKAVAGLQQQRDSLAGMKRDAAAAESALAQMDRELDQLRSARQSGKTPAVTYAAMPAILPPTFNLEDSRKAIALGAGASILFIAGIWIRSRSRDSSVTS